MMINDRNNRLDPQTVHRILLTDPGSLTTSMSLVGTPTFDEFCEHLHTTTDQTVESTVKRACQEQIVQRVEENNNIKPLQDLLLELHTAARSLVPNRPDLHTVLNDEDVKKANTIKQLFPHVIAAGQALSRLESPARSESTLEWREKANNKNDEPTIQFMVSSIFYLLCKAELCQHDVQACHLVRVAPRIYHEGTDMERQTFQAEYGSFQDKDTAPLTRKWISSLVSESSNRNELVESVSAREKLFKEGWITDVLFRGPERPSIQMPEILMLDFEQLNGIRRVTKSAAAGSALALHACNGAGVSTSVLNQPVDATSATELRRLGLVEAMNTRHLYKSKEEYEQHVGKEVVRLAKEWNPSLTENAKTQLESRTTFVLRAEDPVILLLDSRMKEEFSKLMSWKPSSVTVEMRSGHAIDSSQGLDASARAFLESAKSSFCQRGLSFYASDLANVSYLAKKVADLAWKVYGEPMLDKMIIDACKAAKMDPE